MTNHDTTRAVHKESPDMTDLQILRSALACELSPLVRAAEMLAHHERVFRALEVHAGQRPAFAAGLREACPDWSTPGALNGEGALADLLSRAALLCDSLAGTAPVPAAGAITSAEG